MTRYTIRCEGGRLSAQMNAAVRLRDDLRYTGGTTYTTTNADAADAMRRLGARITTTEEGR